MRWTLICSLRFVIRLCVLKWALSEIVLGHHRRVKVIETATLCSPPTFFTVPPIFSASFSLSIFWPMPHITFFTHFVSAFRFYFLGYYLKPRVSNSTCSVSSHSIKPTQPVQKRNNVTKCWSWMLMRMINSNCDTYFLKCFHCRRLAFPTVRRIQIVIQMFSFSRVTWFDEQVCGSIYTGSLDLGMAWK